VDRIKAAVAKLMGSDKAALTFQVHALFSFINNQLLQKKRTLQPPPQVTLFEHH
jgi:hypothetical protein